jgi:GNAT superfamily N-acetyltransferase
LQRDVKYVVRNYKKGDEVRLAQIYSECFGPTTLRDVERWLRRAEVLPEHIFIAEVEGKLVGSVDLKLKKLHLGEEVYLKTGGIAGVCTDSDYRRKGIATNLMQQALNYVKQSGVSNSALFTDLDIPAHRIYSRLGFVDITTEKSFIKYLDYPFAFKRWIRRLNRLLKYAKIAQRKLQGWEKSVVIQLKDVGTLCFRFKRGRFQTLKKPPKTPDIMFSTDVQIID